MSESSSAGITRTQLRIPDDVYVAVRHVAAAEGLSINGAVISLLSVKASKDTILIGELSKILKQNGYNTGQNRLFATLRAEGYLMLNGEGKSIPTQRAMELGLFFMTETTINRPGKDPKVVPTTRVTGKGQVYFVNRFCGKKAENVTMLAAQREQATA